MRSFVRRIVARTLPALVLLAGPSILCAQQIEQVPHDIPPGPPQAQPGPQDIPPDIPPGLPQAQPMPPDGINVQPRGPVHEAFARPADGPQVAPVVPRQPPPPIKEVPPEQRPEGDNVQWVPGYWSWDDQAKDFVWVSGCWRVPPPGRQWVPGQWAQVDGGWQWQPGVWAGNDPGAVQQFDAMPPASPENGPSVPPPNDNSFYMPGQWVFQDGDWVWQAGNWAENQPGMVYVPPAYQPTPNGGSIYTTGYWDYPLEDRGLLFAPVGFNGQQPWVGNPGWAYQPSYAVGFDALLGSLFARPGCGSYYFGNYFGAPYRGLGFVPWSAYGRRGFDPLLNYYAWSNRGNPGWYRGLSGLYAGRLNGSLPVPAATFARQNVVLRSVPNNYSPSLLNQNTVAFNRRLSVNPVNSLRVVQPLSQFGGPVRLTNAAPVAAPRRAIAPAAPVRVQSVPRTAYQAYGTPQAGPRPTPATPRVANVQRLPNGPVQQFAPQRPAHAAPSPYYAHAANAVAPNPAHGGRLVSPSAPMAPRVVHNQPLPGGNPQHQLHPLAPAYQPAHPPAAVRSQPVPVMPHHAPAQQPLAPRSAPVAPVSPRAVHGQPLPGGQLHAPAAHIAPPQRAPQIVAPAVHSAPVHVPRQVAAPASHPAPATFHAAPVNRPAPALAPAAHAAPVHRPAANPAPAQHGGGGQGGGHGGGHHR